MVGLDVRGDGEGFELEDLVVGDRGTAGIREWFGCFLLLSEGTAGEANQAERKECAQQRGRWQTDSSVHVGWGVNYGVQAAW